MPYQLMLFMFIFTDDDYRMMFSVAANKISIFASLTLTCDYCNSKFREGIKYNATLLLCQYKNHVNKPLVNVNTDEKREYKLVDIERSEGEGSDNESSVLERVDFSAEDSTRCRYSIVLSQINQTDQGQYWCHFIFLHDGITERKESIKQHLQVTGNTMLQPNVVGN